jgi:hypothetical protein
MDRLHKELKVTLNPNLGLEIKSPKRNYKLNTVFLSKAIQE